MSQVIDKKIVDMEFNNSRFESNVNHTIGILDKLKQSLNFKGLEKSFDNIEESSKNIKMGNLAESVGKVHEKFSALEVMAVGALMNIGSQAVDAGTKLVKSLSIDQVSAGWSKYAEKTKAVQTIMAATRKEFTDEGEQMEYVNEQLDKLNWFTDETSYSFLDMVNSIGKFTSNSVKLDTAVTAMQGISTWAAISGANVTEAGRAMYNLSQALATGSVKLIDWKSIENANMATAEFKENVIQIAEEMGYLKKISKDAFETTSKGGGDSGLEVSVSNFNEALSKGKWFTNDVLLKALDRYGKFSDKLYAVSEKTGLTATELLQDLDRFKKGTLDIETVAKSTGVSTEYLSKQFTKLGGKSYELGRRAFQAAQEAKTFEEAIDATKDAVSTGWMNTFEIIFGSYDKAKELWTDVANNLWDLFASGGEKRNALLRTALYKDEWDEFSKTIKKTKKQWKDFPKAQAELAKSYKLTRSELEALRKEAKKTGKPVEELIESFGRLSGRELLVKSLQNVFDALFRAIEVVKEAWSDIFPEITAERIYDFIVKIEEFTANLYLTDEKAEKVKDTLRGLFAVLDIGRFILGSIVGVVSEIVKALFDVEDSVDLGPKIGRFLVKLRDTIKSSKTLKETLSGIVDIFKKIIKYFRDTFNGETNLGKLIKKIIDSIKESIDKFKEFRNTLSEKGTVPKNSFISIISSVLGGIKNVIETVAGVALKVWPTIHNIFSTIFDFAKKIGGGAFSAISDFFNQIRNSEEFKAFSEWASESLDKVWKFITETISGENDVGKTLGEVFGTVKETISSIIGIVSEFFDLVFQKEEVPQDSKISAISVIFSGIKSAAEFIGNILQEVWPTLKSVITNFRDFLAKTTDWLSEDGFKNSRGLLKVGILAAVFVKLSKSIKNIKEFGENLSKMFKSIGGTFGSISNYFKELKKSVKYENIKNIAIAIGILIAAFYLLAQLSWDQFLVGLTAFGSILVLLIGFMAIINSKKFNSEEAQKAATAVLTLSAAMLVFALAFKMLAKLSWEDLGKGGAVLVGTLGSFVAASKLLNSGNGVNSKDMVRLAAAMIVMSVALTMLIPPLAALGALPLPMLAKGLLSIIVLLMSAAGAMKLINGVNATAIAAILAVSVAVATLAASMMLLSTIKTDKLIPVVMAFMVLIGTMTLMIMALRSESVESAIAGAALLLLASAILTLSKAFVVFSLLSWENIAKGFVAIAGFMVVAFAASKILGPLAGGIIALSASLSALGKSLLVIGAGIAVIGLGLSLLGAGILAVANAVSLGSTALAAAVAAVLGFIEAMATGLLAILPTIVKLVVRFVTLTINDLIDELGELIPRIVEFAMTLIIDVLESLSEHLPRIVELLMDLLIKLIHGLAEKIPELVTELVNLFVSTLTAFTDALSQIDPQVLTEGLLAIGVISAIMVAMAGLAVLAPAAMLGIVAFGALVLELAGVLAALSLVFKNEDFVATVKTTMNALGEIIGAFIGGLAEGIAESLPPIADTLSDFIVRLQPFIDGVKGLDSDFLDKALMIPKILLAILGTEIIEGLTNWLLGSNSDAIGKFCDNIVQVGQAIRDFSITVSGLDRDAVISAASAAEALNEFVKHSPKYGGLVAVLEGENDLVAFAVGIASIGAAIKDFYEQVRTVNPKVVMLSAAAAQSLTVFADNVPKHGGLKAIFEGDNSLVTFAIGMISTGIAIKDYYEQVKDINPNVVAKSAIAANAIAKFADNIPNSGGLKSWFEGDNSVSAFASQLPGFGASMAKYSASITENGGIDTEAMENSSVAASAIVEVAKKIKKDELGDLDFWTGKTQFTVFGQSLAGFAEGLVAYSSAVSGENKIAVMPIITSAIAAGALATVANTITSNELGKGDFWTGKTQFTVFGQSLSGFADSLKDYSSKVSGDQLDISAIKESAGAAASIVDVCKIITGNDLGSHDIFNNTQMDFFGKSLSSLGTGIKAYSDAVKGIEVDDEKIGLSLRIVSSIGEVFANRKLGKISFTDLRTNESRFAGVLPKIASGIKGYCDNLKGIEISPAVVSYSVMTAKQIAGLYEYIPKLGGIAALIEGDESLDRFGASLQSLATGVYVYCSSINAMPYEPEKVTSSIQWLKDLSALYDYIPKFKGIVSWFEGDEDLTAFANSLSSLADGFTAYAKIVSSIGWDTAKIDQSITTARNLSDLLTDLSEYVEYSTVGFFSDTLLSFGDNLIAYKDKVASLISNVGYDPIHKSIADVRAILTLFNDLKALDGTCADNFLSALNKLGNSSVTEFTKAFTDGHSSIKTSAEELVKVAENAIRDKVSKMYDAGKAAARGFSNGLSSISSQALAANAGRIIGQVALDALKKALKINSPSKEFEYTGEDCPEGFYNGAIKGLKYSRMAGEKIGKEALSSTSKALSQISEILDTNINTDPVIRPVIDLDGIRKGSLEIDSMFSSNRALSISARMANNDEQAPFGSRSMPPVTQMTFNQYNNSPKALTPIEIYRQTKNQFASLQRRTNTYYDPSTRSD